jgi:hypothetical protein
MADQIRSVNGANALIKVKVPGSSDYTVVGYATGVSVTENILVNRIDVLGQIDTKDIEPIARTVSGTIGLMRMTPMEDKTGGGASYQGVLADSTSGDAIARTKAAMDFYNDGFDLYIVDSAAFAPDSQARTRYEIKGCRPTSHSFAMSRGSLMGVNISFEALALLESDALSPTRVS